MSEKYTAIIVDDEASARSILSNLLSNFCPQIEIVSTCEDIPSAAAAIKEHGCNLVFLDIEMPNYAGYEILDFVDEVNFEIIFVTAYDHYAIKAFELSAIDYLLKPIEIDRLKDAIDKFIRHFNTQDAAQKYEVLKESMKTDQVKKIVANVQGGQKILEVANIVAIQAEESYSTVYTNDGESYLFSKNLKQFENLFEEDQRFMRTHKSWIVNVSYLKQYSKSRLTILLENNIEAKLSKYKKDEFETYLLK